MESTFAGTLRQRHPLPAFASGERAYGATEERPPDNPRHADGDDARVVPCGLAFPLDGLTRARFVAAPE